MNRGDIVTVALPGAYGKHRPAVIVQADRFNHLGSITFLPFTSDLLPAEIFRILVNLSSENGLQAPSPLWRTSAVHYRWPRWAAYSGASALPISEGSIEHSQLSWVSPENRLR